MAEISVVSGTYNRLPLLKQMVESARQSAGALPIEIVLVDGGSTDGTQDWCRAQPDVLLLEHGELRGAIAAFNDGARAASAPYVVLLNDDVTINGDTLRRAKAYLDRTPEVGMVAFAHRYQRRKEEDRSKDTVQTAYGYAYGQCCMVRRWLGELAGWWGDEGMRTYGGDTRLSLRLWEWGWPTIQVDGCSVTDHEHEDELRQINSDTPWRQAKVDGKAHPDLEKFSAAWNGRLPKRDAWIAAPSRRVLKLAMDGQLRTLRFKAMMRPGDAPRLALINSFVPFGPARQISMLPGKPVAYLDRIAEFMPDLVLFQAQNPSMGLTPDIVRDIRKRWPWIVLLNWDGDAHVRLLDYHYEIASVVDLQLVVSPSLFGRYAEHGIGVGYWPIAVEQAYLDVERARDVTGPDVVFTGTSYPNENFPEADFRRNAITALYRSGLSMELHGYGWNRIGIPATETLEQHEQNAALMANAKMAVSISHFTDLWGYSSDRLYNITATGCPALVHRFAGMEQHGYIDGETCIVFDDIPSLLDKARRYATHDHEREKIGLAGRDMTRSRHTWPARLEGLWAMLEGLP